MTVVADATPLIAFARADRLDVLRDVVGTVLVPRAVHEEVVTRGAGKPGSDAVRDAPWIVLQPAPTAEATVFPDALGAGEREAIVLARARGLVLVTDDRVARAVAQSLGVRTTWSLALLVVAEERGLLPDAVQVADAMIAAGLRVADAAYARFCAAAANARALRAPR